MTKNLKNELKKLAKGEKIFGNLTPEDIRNGVVSFHSWYDPMNRDERYVDHATCRWFVETHPSIKHPTIIWTDGYAGNTTNISLKHLHAWVFGYLPELLKNEELLEEVLNQKLSDKKTESVTKKVIDILPDGFKILAVDLGKLLRDVPCHVPMSCLIRENLLAVTYTDWKSHLWYNSWDDPTYCTELKAGDYVNEVDDYHHRSTIIFCINGSSISIVGSSQEKSLFRTTRRGIVGRCYDSHISGVHRTNKKIVITFKTGGNLIITPN